MKVEYDAKQILKGKKIDGKNMKNNNEELIKKPKKEETEKAKK